MAKAGFKKSSTHKNAGQLLEKNKDSIIGINDPNGLYNNPLTNEPYQNIHGHMMKDIKVYEKDISKQELQEFLESLPQDNFSDIRDFFDTMPKLKHKIEVLNPKTNVKSDVFFVGLSDFFE